MRTRTENANEKERDESQCIAGDYAYSAKLDKT